MTYPKAEGLLSSDELTVTSDFKGNAGLRLWNKPREFKELFQIPQNQQVPYEFVTYCDMICLKT
ncbi:hypothetical protein TSAR_006062 [Trichomalopsis sarcophagae]|uniref:Uncharacterized protein n=1 Tax=Trichomalopsis sarcophagae TaxID=543379 RepID=A0A232EDW1_9HYME|nr:hypothetical protein TSAR_006062 [Trichomalopsis sarcophagae]